MPAFIPQLLKPSFAPLRHPARAPYKLHQRYFEWVLGTALEVQIRAQTLEVAYKAEAALLFEIDRLERVFSRFLPDSELNVLLSGDGEQRVSLELSTVLRDSLAWTAHTRGAFNPASEALSQVWREAENQGVRPSSARLQSVLEACREPPYRVDTPGRTATPLLSAPLNFNAIAKGFIADQACHAAFALKGVSEVVVNLGGDLRHRGGSRLEVLLEDPFKTVDNAPPLARVRLSGQAVATSGGSRRGFQVAGEWFSHILDPRTGQPAGHIASASVLADTCATADVLATAFTVLEPLESFELASQWPRVGYLLVTQVGEVYSNAFWDAAALSGPLPAVG